MRCERRTLRTAAVVAFALVASACGGGSDTSTEPVDSGSTDTASPQDLSPAQSSAEPELSDETSDDTSDETSDETSGESGSLPECPAIFATSEIEELFAEPAELTEEVTESLGQLVCTWETIEDPNDTEDLAFKILTVQVYSGDPIPASSFFDPSLFETVVTIAGVGDLAYSTDDFGASFSFVDEPIGGTLSWTEVDMGDPDAPKLRTRDDIEQLFRTFHDRVT